jgi:hypothetical protein
MLTAGSEDLRIISLSPMRSEKTIPPGNPFVPTLSIESDHGVLGALEAKESLLPYDDNPFFPRAFLPIACIPPPKTCNISFSGDFPFLLFSPDGDSEYADPEGEMSPRLRDGPASGVWR